MSKKIDEIKMPDGSVWEIGGESGSSDAKDIKYDNSASQIEVSNVQDILDKITGGAVNHTTYSIKTISTGSTDATIEIFANGESLGQYLYRECNNNPITVNDELIIYYWLPNWTLSSNIDSIEYDGEMYGKGEKIKEWGWSETINFEVVSSTCSTFNSLFSKVIPNPEEDATEELKKIKINDIVYEITGRGGGSSAKLEQLYEGTDLVDTITLNKSFKEYDILIVNGYAGNNYSSSNIYICKDIVNEEKIGIVTDNDYCWYKIINETTLAKSSSNGTRLTNIYGLNFDSGGGGEGSSDYIEYNEETETVKFKNISGGESKSIIHEYSLEEQIVGKWVDGRNIYEKTYIFDTPFTIMGWTNLLTNDEFYDMRPINGIGSTDKIEGVSDPCVSPFIFAITNNTLRVYNSWGTYLDTATIQYVKKSERS